MKSRVAGLCLFFMFTVLTVWGTDRAAMVLETKGSTTTKLGKAPVRLRTLQVLDQGSKVTVDQGAVLRLSFFSSGNKETLTGPCTVAVNAEGSEKLSGSGKVEVERRRNSSTEVKKSDNLRRMGGALQANLTATPESELAKLDAPEVALEQPPKSFPKASAVGGSVAGSATQGTKPVESPSTTPPSGTTPPIAAPPQQEPPIGRLTRGASAVLLGRSPRYLSTTDAAEVQWRGQRGPISFEVLQENKKIGSVSGRGPSVQLPLNSLQAGKTYTLYSPDLKDSKGQTFYIYSAQERLEYEALVKEINRSERQDRRARFGRLIYLQASLDLLATAERTAEQALLEYPNDSGFLFSLGQLEAALGKPDEARAHFRKAKELENL